MCTGNTSGRNGCANWEWRWLHVHALVRVFQAVYFLHTVGHVSWLLSILCTCKQGEKWLYSQIWEFGCYICSYDATLLTVLCFRFYFYVNNILYVRIRMYVSLAVLKIMTYVLSLSPLLLPSLKWKLFLYLTYDLDIYTLMYIL